MTTPAAVPEVNVEQSKLQEEVQLVVKDGGAIVVNDQGSYDAATTFLTTKVNPQLAKINTFFDANIQSAHLLHKNLLAQKKSVSDPVEGLKRKLSDAILSFELKMRAEQQQREREAAEAQRKRDEEARIQNAVEAEESGATREEVQAVLETPTNEAFTKPVVAPVLQKAAGIAIKSTWKAGFESDNEDACIRKLCKAIGEGKAPTNYVDVNFSAINKVANAQRQSFDVPGFKANAVSGIASRSRG